MTRYAIRPAQPRADLWDTPAQALPHPTVDASEPVNTGLFDKNGNPIWRMPDAIGFLPRDGGER